jgi:hypothetical protein
VDSVTLVVTAVALGASAGLTETASSAVKDAYAGLKGLLNHRQIDVSAIERGPDSTVQRQALREMLAAVPDVVDQDLLDAAEQVTDVVAADQPDAAVRGVPRAGLPLYLVYGTGSDKGVEAMKDAMRTVDGSEGMSFRDPRTGGAVPVGQMELLHEIQQEDELTELLLQRLHAGAASVKELEVGCLGRPRVGDAHMPDLRLPRCVKLDLLRLLPLGVQLRIAS